MTKKSVPIRAQGTAAMHAILARADAPGATTDDRAQLSRLYDEVPSVWKAMGDLALSAESRLITQTVKNYSQQAAIARHLTLLRDELGYHTASRLEKLLIEQVVLCWMRMQVQELVHTAAIHTKDGCTTTKAEHQERMLVSVQTRYLRAIECLARVRRLLKLTIQVNVATPGSQQVNVVGDVQRAPEDGQA